MSKPDQDYDIVVVGAGPAGSMAAMTAAKAGCHVLLIEKRQEIGSPVRCAEGLARSDLERLVEINSAWICAEVNRYRVFSPDGTALTVRRNSSYYVLERKIFDRDLAEMAASAGAHVLAKTAATGLLCDDAKRAITGVMLNVSGTVDIPVRCKVVIGADGVESQVGRWAGIDTVPRMRDMHSTAQYLLGGVDIDQDACEFYFGSAIAPGGYAWVFPKGKRMANVGLGIVARRENKSTAKAFLDQFVEPRFPSASILSVVVGGIPLSETLRDIVANGLMLVGDAAHQAFPHTGGGIHNAMIAGVMAAKVAAQAIRNGDYSSRFLGSYAVEWDQTIGKEIAWAYRFKRLLLSTDEQKLNRIIAKIGGVDFEKFSTKEILLAVIRADPSLLLEARHLL